MDFISDKFKNLIDYKSGYTWSKDQESSTFVKDSVRVLTVTNIQEKLDLGSELYLSRVSEKDRKRKAASKGWSIAVSSNGNRKRIGNAVFVDDDTDYLFASFLTGFIPRDTNILLPKYFFYWLSTHPIQERITSVSEGTTGLGNLDIRFLRKIDLAHPEDLLEQNAIVGILSKVDEAIEAVENSIKSAQRLKKSLMQNLLTGKLKPDGTWRSEEEFYVVEKFGKVPKGWKLKSIGECFDFFPTSSYSRATLNEDGQCLYIHYGDIHIRFDTFINFNEKELPCISSKMAARFEHLKSGDLVISDASEDYDGVGKAVELLNVDNRPVIAGLHTLHLREKDNLFVVGFKGFILMHPKVRNLLLRSSTGIKVYSVSKTELKKIPLPIPPKKEQVQVIDKLNSANFIITWKKSKIQSLTTLKKSLMQNLLTGKVRVDVEKINKLLEEV